MGLLGRGGGEVWGEVALLLSVLESTRYELSSHPPPPRTSLIPSLATTWPTIVFRLSASIPQKQYAIVAAKFYSIEALMNQWPCLLPGKLITFPKRGANANHEQRYTCSTFRTRIRTVISLPTPFFFFPQSLSKHSNPYGA